jgi:sugar lactone lactonase YvrE
MSTRARLAALLTLAMLIALPVANASADDANDCPSSGSKTLMLADDLYGCGYLDRWDNHSIGAWATQSWSSYPALGYRYDYYCDYQSGGVGIVRLTTQGKFHTEVINGEEKTIPDSPGSITYTATNTQDGSRHWAVGAIWNTGNPRDGTLPAPGLPPVPPPVTDPLTPDPVGLGIAYTKNCGSSKAQIPSWVLYQTVFKDVTLPSGATVPDTAGTTGPVADGGSVAVGSAYTVGVTSDVLSQDPLPDGQPLVLQTLGSDGTTWTNVAQTVTGDTSAGALFNKGCVARSIGPGCAATSAGLADAEGVAVSPDGKSVYVASSDDDAIVRFDRDVATGGVLTPRGCISDTSTSVCGSGNQAQGLNGARGVAVSPDGKSVYVASSADDAIVRFDRGADGALGASTCVMRTGATGCFANSAGLSDARAVAVSPDGKSVYVVSSGDDAIVRFNPGADGALGAGSCVARSSGAGCAATSAGLADASALAVSKDGKSVYVAGTADNAIVRFDRDAATGALTAKGCVSDTSTSVCGSGNQAQGLNGARGVAVSPDGKSIYVASSDDDAIVRIARGADGALGASTCVARADGTGCFVTAAGLADARGVAVSPDGKSVYVAASGDDAIVRFDLGADGALGVSNCVMRLGGSIGCRSSAQGLADATGVTVSPDGRSVYVASTYDDAVVAFARSLAPPGQATSQQGGGVLAWKPATAGSYTLRVVYPGLNVASPGRGYTPVLSGTFTVTVTGASARSARARAATSAAADPLAVVSAYAPDGVDRILETQRAGFGGLTIVNSQFFVPEWGPAPSSLSELGCPKGFTLVHIEAASIGDDPPDDGVTVGESSSGRVKLKIPRGARGFAAQAQLTCRRSTAKQVARRSGIAYGTTKGDTITATRRNSIVYGGLGGDRLLVTGTGGSAVGGLGNDTLVVRAAKGNAIGGPGDDTLLSTSTRRTLLWGGPGKDRITGSRGPTLINALDGQGGDTVRCRSNRNRVLSDPGDTVIGPCASRR